MLCLWFHFVCAFIRTRDNTAGINPSVILVFSLFTSPLSFHPQRTGTRRRYQDDGISDDEIEGKRMFDLDEKLSCDRFNSELIKHMKGEGEQFDWVNRSCCYAAKRTKGGLHEWW